MITNRELIKAKDVKSLLPIYQKINALIINQDWNEIDTIFLHLDIPKMSDVLLIGLLRLTLIWRGYLKSWDILLEAVETHLDKFRNDSKELLRGLR